MKSAETGLGKLNLHSGIRNLYKSSLMLLSVISLLLFPAGCSSAQDGDKKEDSFMDKYAAPVTLEHTSLKFYFPGVKPKNWDEVRAEIEKRSADAVNASLDFKWIDFENYLKRVKTLDASGEIFDAFCVGKPDLYSLDFTTLAREGKLADITKFFPENAPSLYSKYTKEELEYAKVNNRLYAVPSLYPTAYGTYILVDDALYKKYNIPEITNLDQYEAFLKAVRENRPQATPGMIVNNVNTLQLFARMFGYVILDDSQQLVYKWDDPKMTVLAWEQTPEYQEAVNKIADWYGKGYFQDITELKDEIASFIRYGQLLPSSEEPQTQSLAVSGVGVDFKIIKSNPMKVFFLNPERKVQRDNSMGTYLQNGSFVFPASSSNTARALRFLDWVQQNRDNYTLVIYGIENKDYVMSYGNPRLPPGMDPGERSYMDWDGSWALKNAGYETNAPTNGLGDGIKSYTEFLDKYTIYPSHGVFYPDYSEMIAAAYIRSGSIRQFERKLMEGRIKDAGEVSKFIREMKDNGVDNMIADIQKQLDKK